jgi:hypothetical protein
MRNARAFLAVLLSLGVSTAGCGMAVPESIRVYAAELPARVDREYTLVSDEGMRASLVRKDAMLQCYIDVEEHVPERGSAACRCAHSAGKSLVECTAWLGAHTPSDGRTPPEGASIPNG